MFEIDDTPIDPDLRVACIEQFLNLFEIVKESKKPEEKYRYPWGKLSISFDFDKDLNIFVEAIQVRRRSKIFIPAFKFTSADVPPPRDACECRVLDVIYDTEASGNGRLAPIYFKRFFEMSLDDLHEFKYFLSVLDYKIHELLRLYNIWMRLEHGRLTRNLQNLTELSSISESHSSRIIEIMNSVISRVTACEQTLRIKSELASQANDALDFFCYSDSISMISNETAIRLMKLRDFLFHSLEEYENCILETVQLVRYTHAQLASFLY